MKCLGYDDQLFSISPSCTSPKPFVSRFPQKKDKFLDDLGFLENLQIGIGYEARGMLIFHRPEKWTKTYEIPHMFGELKSSSLNFNMFNIQVPPWFAPYFII